VQQSAEIFWLTASVDFATGAGLKPRKAQDFIQQLMKAYPNDPVLGSPFDGQYTNYGQGSQYKRAAAILTDGTFVEPWFEYLGLFSARTQTYGLLWSQPAPGTPESLGVNHGADVNFYFPLLAGKERDRNSDHGRQVVNVIHTALVNFVHYGDPNGCPAGLAAKDGYVWPEYSESGMITVVGGPDVATAEPPPHRPGFEVFHRFLRPGHF